MQKIILVGYAQGRTGSSALVGMFDKMNLTVKRTVKKDSNNKRMV